MLVKYRQMLPFLAIGEIVLSSLRKETRRL